MTVIVAKSAGFCFGVERAVTLATETAGRCAPCCTFGELIHNKSVTDELAALGATVANSVGDVREGENAAVILRSHGVTREITDALARMNVEVVDATCPFVEKIHRIVRDAEDEGRLPVIIGARDHAEVTATAGQVRECAVFDSAEGFAEWIIEGDRGDLPVAVVFQTTLLRGIFEKTGETAKKLCTNAKIYDTICAATQVRQSETRELASRCDVMIVIGDRHSANAMRLYEIAADQCTQTFFVESAEELPRISGDITVGVTAGASTPARIIMEVNQKMYDELETRSEETVEPIVSTEISEETAIPAVEPTAEIAEPIAETAEPTAETPASETTEDAQPAAPETFEEMLEKSIKILKTGDRVVGTVAAITPTEVTVDLGIKQSGYILISELSDDPTKPPEEIVKIGDPIETFVIRVNDVEGYVQLSRRRIDAIKSWSDITAASEDHTVVEGKVAEVNKGGLVVTVRGIRVFIPASQSGLPREADLNQLVGKTVKLLVREVNQQRRRVVGSISAVTNEERKLNSAKIWEEIEVGKKYHGVVKSLTSYGAFVDVGGVDGMVHVSELTWQRVRQPSEVVKVGDELDVYVISYDPERRKISLGAKDREKEPWTEFTTKYGIGDTAPVKVVKLMAFGAFAQVLPGVDGLIHVSQITDHRINSPAEVLHEGDEVNVKITDIDFDRHKISLSIRALLEEEQGQYDDEDDNSGGDAIVYDTDHPNTEIEIEE
ncbi:MAG: bifunctional 4-hydroxy-3-methylbut-2-enyl diphosphate reductase/30S ribosomal protein S1 [Oscillospiraceae bacterium]|nr:bifunctional 4-hydroxy-3-methylbut-2-enyl diphosphate reductase/30S ribosomal protein S1 [Oscillospiraceae bacterium]